MRVSALLKEEEMRNEVRVAIKEIKLLCVELDFLIRYLTVVRVVSGDCMHTNICEVC